MFIPLHMKSDYSLGYGTASVDELVEVAATLGYKALALTDLENLYGQVRFHHQCRLRGLKAITGVELRPGFDGRRHLGRRSGRVILLALDETGYGSLCRIVSRRRGGILDRIKNSKVDPLPLIVQYTEGLIALSDDPSVIKHLVEAFPRERLGLLLIRPDSSATEQTRRKTALDLGVRLVADLDTIFLKPDDHPLHQLQLAIRQNLRMEEVTSGDCAESPERWLRMPADAEALFADIPEAISATAEIAEACSFDLGEIKEGVRGLAPSYKEDAGKRLRHLCEEAITDLFPQAPGWTPSHRSRLNHELEIFESLGFSGFMLIVAEILAHCRHQGIPVVVRGSAVSSLALHLLGGAPVDPLRHGLLFERFLHRYKSAWPDVDIDLPWHRRDEVIQWVYESYGRDRVAMVAAHHTFQYRSALQEGLKAWEVHPALIEGLSRALPHEELLAEEVDFLGLADTAHRVDPMAEVPPDLDEETTSLSKILPVIRRLVGRPHHIAAHPGGIVVSCHPLENLLPLERALKGVVIAQYDLMAVAKLGLVKIDLLGNRCLSELEESLTLAGHPQPLRLESIPSEDPTTLTLIDRADTIGCFQLESPAMRALLSRLPIRRQSDITAALALIRPGAAAGEVKTAFIRHARGEKPDQALFPVMADRLGETHGLFLYEEDIMVLLSRMGGLTLEEADELRKVIVESGGESAVLSSLERDFLERARERGAKDMALVRQAWETAARFAAYSFNKAHAASYGFLAYLSAYTKAHHPLEFACALLNHHQGLYPLRTEAWELVRMGIALRGPHVNRSEYHSYCEDRKNRTRTDAVRVGLDKVKNLSLHGAVNILQERSERGAFTSLRNLLERVRLSHREVSALVLSGACDGLKPLTGAGYPFAHEAALEAIKQRRNLSDLDALPIPQPAAADSDRIKLFQALTRVRNELTILEMHLLAHPMALLRQEASRYRCLPIGKSPDSPAGAWLRLAVIVSAMRRVPTRQGPMQFLTLEDETGLLEAAVLPPAYRRIGNMVTTPGPYLVEGKLRKQQGGVHLDVIKLAPFHQRKRPFEK